MPGEFHDLLEGGAVLPVDGGDAGQADGAVLDLVLAQGFVSQLPMGYHSLIGDMGAMMSAGQQQRLLLARAVYARPNILFLDEATANIDAQTAKQILINIKELNVTTVIVTHQVNLLPELDQTIELA